MFQHRLALALGMTVEEMLEKMSYYEYIQWQKFYQHDPWGDYRDDLRMGVIASTITNVAQGLSGGKKKGKSATPEDFVLFGKSEKKELVFANRQEQKEYYSKVLRGL